MESVNISIIMVAYTAFVRQASQMKQHVEFFPVWEIDVKLFLNDETFFLMLFIVLKFGAIKMGN